MGGVTQFLTDHIVYVYFFYGLAFFSMGLAIWLASSRFRTSEFRLAAALLLLAGFGVLGKYTNLFLGLGFLLFLLSSRERRRWLLHWQLWAGGLLALLVLSPNIWWNLAHDWSGMLFQGRRIVTTAYASDMARNFFDLIRMGIRWCHLL